jgi:hypothetical protein
MYVVDIEPIRRQVSDLGNQKGQDSTFRNKLAIKLGKECSVQLQERYSAFRRESSAGNTLNMNIT